MTWRLLDTGPRPAAENIALDAAMLALCARGLIPPTVRFLGFSPGAALIGRHQTVPAEIREDYCRQSGIQINRRLTGGGAVFFDLSQIGWEIIAPRDALKSGPRLEELTEYMCRGAIRGLARLGVAADFRPRNDIEAGGRKLCGTGGAYEDGALLFQGTLLVDFDAEAMIRALRVPTEKLSAHEIDSARQRVTCLRDLLGGAGGPCRPGDHAGHADGSALPERARIHSALAAGFAEEFGIDLKPGSLSPAEIRESARLLPFYGSDGWIDEIREPADAHRLFKSIHKAEGGLVRTSLSVDVRRRRVRSVMFTGDFFVTPARAILDLEASLKDAGLEEAGSRIEEFFAESDMEAMRMEPGDFRTGLNKCLEKLELPDHGISLDDANRVSIVGPGRFAEVVSAAGVLLLPYCAKLPECGLRYEEGCDMCGDCGVGEACELALARGIAVVTVQDYEHLEEVLAACRGDGIRSFIGCCCQAFLARRHRVFTESGLSGVLLDIGSDTCYDLSLEEEAYRGRFRNQTELPLDLLGQVLQLVMRQETAPGS